MSFSVICADPPWMFGDLLPGATRGAQRNYDVLALDDIRKFPLPPIADNAWLFLWRVSSQVEEAYSVVRAWGFTPKSEIVWEKLTVGGKAWFGMGRYVRAAHETCIVSVRGRVQPLARNVRSRFAAPVLGHSRKPEEFYAIVEQLAAGPYVEMFARRERPGWTCLGNELPQSTGEELAQPGGCAVEPGEGEATATPASLPGQHGPAHGAGEATAGPGEPAGHGPGGIGLQGASGMNLGVLAAMERASYMPTDLPPGAVGVAVDCTTCGLRKPPRGRSVAPEAANGMCSWECPGYAQDPKPGDLWPGETREQFGYP